MYTTILSVQEVLTHFFVVHYYMNWVKTSEKYSMTGFGAALILALASYFFIYYIFYQDDIGKLLYKKGQDFLDI